MEHPEHEIPDLLRTDLPAVERERILRHLDACASCREKWESIQILRPSSRRQPADVPDGYFATLPARIVERRLRPERAAWLRPFVSAARPLIPVIAGALMIYVLLDISWIANTPANRLPVAASDAAEYLTSDPSFHSADLASVVEQLLSDRSFVVLDARAEVTGLEDLEAQTASDLVAGLDEAEMELLLSKLSERALL